MAEKPENTKKFIYYAGIRWNWYYIIIGDEFAQFRLHQYNDSAAWDIFDEFEKENTYGAPGSDCYYEHSCSKIIDPPESSAEISSNSRFDFLKDFLSKYFKYEDVFGSLGVKFYKLEE